MPEVHDRMKIEAAAAALGCSWRNIYRYAKSGQLTLFKAGDGRSWLDRRQVEALAAKRLQLQPVPAR